MHTCPCFLKCKEYCVVKCFSYVICPVVSINASLFQVFKRDDLTYAYNMYMFIYREVWIGQNRLMNCHSALMLKVHRFLIYTHTTYVISSYFLLPLSSFHELIASTSLSRSMYMFESVEYLSTCLVSFHFVRTCR